MLIIYILMKYICIVIVAGWYCDRKAVSLFTDKEMDGQNGQTDK